MDERRDALRALLQSARARTTPESLGLPERPRRRKPGLVVEEVAELVGVSEGWYARFEAGHARMSIKALHRLADTLGLRASERARLIELALPDFERFGRAPTPAGDLALTAFRRFARRSEAATSPRELFDMAATAVVEGLPHAVFSSVVTRDPRGRWLHASADFPDVADVINSGKPLDDAAMAHGARLRDGIRFFGHPDYGETACEHCRERRVRTPLRSGFGVPIPMMSGVVGFCSKERGHAESEHLIFLQNLATTVALTLRSTGGMS